MSSAISLRALQQKIDAAALKAGRQPHEVRLVAVSKGVDAERLFEALSSGQRVFAENYVQEAASKWEGLRGTHSFELRLIGHLQTNKAEQAVRLFDRIDTLDRLKLAQALAKAFAKTGKAVPLLIEVNSGAEPQKSGCLVEDVPELLKVARDLGLDVRGLMCVPPVSQDPTPYFKQLAELAKAHGLVELSMGMSADYETAIACGATEVRVGTALFGMRAPKAS
jgi:pyridoxal phosphate enzyme (YggS family)